MRDRLSDLYKIEELSRKDTFVHRLHPTAKLLTTAVFIVTIVSFDRFSLLRLIPYIFYPALLMALSETPYALLLKRLLIALPFCLFTGFSNVWLERAAAFSVGGVTVSYGVLSFTVLLLRTYLCVMAVLILVAVTPLFDLSNSLRQLKVPGVFIVILETAYRYIGVLLREAGSLYTAYSLRSPGVRGIKLKDTGSFIGSLLLRSFERADRVYNAMLCRGYGSGGAPRAAKGCKPGDVIFFVLTATLCILLRLFDMTIFIKGLI